MTPKVLFEPIRKQQLLRSIRGPEAERKKLFKIARLRESQGRPQPQPFLSTALGKLPPEIRVLIYQYLVVKSGLSILRTCRQIYIEAHPIFDAGGIPYFANAGELYGFLKGVGPTGRLQLEAFRIGSLVSQDGFEEVYGPPLKFRIFYLDSNGSIKPRYKKVDPDVRSAFSLLIECKKLCTIYVDMKQGEEVMHYALLRTFVDGVYTKLHHRGVHHWFAHRLDEQGFRHAFEYRVPFLVPPWGIYRALVSSGRPMGRDVLVIVDMNPPPSREPFPKTRLGKLPQKLRIQIYHELVSIRPIHAGQMSNTQGIVSTEQDPHGPLTPSATFFHLQASCLKVLSVCRQMYVEAHPIFYSRGSFYTHNTKELRRLSVRSLRSFSQSLFRITTIRSFTVNSLCVRDLVSWSDEKGYYLDNLDFESVYGLRKWDNLQKLCLCMRAGEEVGYLEFLFLLPRMSHGVVEFLDDAHWVLHRQCPQEEWQIQYACFGTNLLGYRRGKSNVELSLEDIEIQRQILRVDSAATKLNQGEERYVEVDIGGTSKARMLSGLKELMEKSERLSLDG